MTVLAAETFFLASSAGSGNLNQSGTFTVPAEATHIIVVVAMWNRKSVTGARINSVEMDYVSGDLSAPAGNDSSRHAVFQISAGAFVGGTYTVQVYGDANSGVGVGGFHVFATTGPIKAVSPPATGTQPGYTIPSTLLGAEGVVAATGAGGTSGANVQLSNATVLDRAGNATYGTTAIIATVDELGGDVVVSGMSGSADTFGGIVIYLGTATRQFYPPQHPVVLDS